MALINFSLGDIGELVKDVREAFTGKGIEDPVKIAEIKLKLKELEQALQLGQIKINEKEANHPNIFVSGWRPFIGWIGGFSIAYQFIIYPFLFSVLGSMGIDMPLPPIDTGMLMNLVLAMLGIAGLRSYEKVKGVNGNHK